MSATAQYATVPRNSIAQVSTANANRDGTGTLANVLTASSVSGSGTRIDSLIIQAAGTTTAGMVRLYLTKGRPGPVISSISFVTTTATVTTAAAHGLTTGQLVTVVGTLPDDYNVESTAITVTGATTFTYTMGTTPTANAVTLGNFSTTLATATSRLIAEVLVSAVTPSATVAAFFSAISQNSNFARGVFPLILQPGWSLRASTEKAETFNIIPTFAGDFA